MTKSKKWTDIEEALGIIWTHRERKEQSRKMIEDICATGVSDTVMADLTQENFVRIDGDLIYLTPEGERIGRNVTRRHRLAERLLADVIEVKGEEMNLVACEFEHILSEDVADAICTLLGHPKVCPHGSPIPPGPCCEKAEGSIEAIVVPLDRLPVGEKAEIAYIVTVQHPFLHKLLSLGIVPGTEILLHQRSPSFVIKSGETQIAFDAAVAGQIYVRRS